MLCAPEHATLCVHHIRVRARDAGEIPPALRPLLAPGELDNPWAVRRTIKRLLALYLEGKFTPEQARSLTAMARLLLVSTRRPRKRGRPAQPRVRGLAVESHRRAG